jgi:hypothetical protein
MFENNQRTFNNYLLNFIVLQKNIYLVTQSLSVSYLFFPFLWAGRLQRLIGTRWCSQSKPVLSVSLVYTITISSQRPFTLLQLPSADAKYWPVLVTLYIIGQAYAQFLYCGTHLMVTF